MGDRGVLLRGGTASSDSSLSQTLTPRHTFFSKKKRGFQIIIFSSVRWMGSLDAVFVHFTARALHALQ
jgi:hypothetical protein